MSLLDKPLKPLSPRHSHKRLYISLGIPAAVLALLLLFTNLSTDAAFVVHFVSAPKHFAYNGHSNYISAVAWSPDGKRIASASNDGSVQIWQALTGKRLAIYSSSTDIRGKTVASNAVAFSPDGKDVVIGTSGPAVLIDAATARAIGYLGPHGGSALSVAFSPRGRYLAVGRDDSTVEVWDVSTSTEVYVYMGHSAPVFTLAWSPDGKRIASGGADCTVQIWDALTGNHVYTYGGHADYYWGHFTSDQDVDSIAWSPDGKQIASGSTDNTVQVWMAM